MAWHGFGVHGALWQTADADNGCFLHHTAHTACKEVACTESMYRTQWDRKQLVVVQDRRHGWTQYTLVQTPSDIAVIQAALHPVAR